MSAALQNYESGGEMYLGGLLLAEITKGSVNHMGNLNEVNTTIKGLAGTASGPLKVEISINSAIPKAGLEYDYYLALINRSILRFRMKVGGRTISYEVRADTFDVSLDASNAADASVKFIGKPLGATT